MATSTTQSLKQRKQQMTRDAVLDAAERLLQNSSDADFSMRSLAEAAGVGFTTPFNYFGNKNAILRALAERYLLKITIAFDELKLPSSAYLRVREMSKCGFEVLMQQPRTYRTVVSALNQPHPEGPDMRHGAHKLWLQALGDFTGICSTRVEIARCILPDQLTISFRGILTLWVSGELTDFDLVPTMAAAIGGLFFGLADSEELPMIERDMLEADSIMQHRV
ncbi:TetR/AcrR family transcriptional regulator [Aquisediminimonas profunda]|uniref:TetR/AcrR family transcriptional regulator n=1 Tax=Aquisediminimonas profunda TaxID=1550733 RepID=UPI001C628CDA|nr:TetR/AcrR family transcriptional regulator [Aquisediminimonas profunda]